MCTVTLIASKRSGFILTSNRDEAGDRKTIPPRSYKEYGVELLFPKDELAGGTWIGVSDRSRLLCLLNGGYQNHQREEFYRKSRGVVTKELLAEADFDKAIMKYNFYQIEPFTMILAEWSSSLRFAEFVWDGEQKHLKELELNSHIWSSSPLYTSAMKETRRNWFRDFQKKAGSSPQDLWEFHHSAGIGDKHLDLIMDRGYVKTQSITQIVKIDSTVQLTYEDLKTSKIYQHFFSGQTG